MNLAKKNVFNINMFLLQKLHQFCKNNQRKNKNIELIGVSMQPSNKKTSHGCNFLAQ
jgi:hypothetical protein